MKNKDLHLVAYYIIKPKNPQRTSQPGYIKDAENIDYDESINITKGLKDKDVALGGVILNLSRQLVVKNRFRSDNDFASLLAYYQEGYAQYLDPIIAKLYKEELNEANIDVSSQEEKESSGSQCSAEAITTGAREGNEGLAQTV